MKTSISLPDDVFEEATQRARQLGMSRSELFTRAARRYLAELTGQSLTAQIDQALQAAGEDEDEAGSAAAAPAGRRERVVTRRGSLYWVDPDEPRDSKPAKRRPVLVVQAEAFNASRLNTRCVAASSGTS
jgi:hypothetical protein